MGVTNARAGVGITSLRPRGEQMTDGDPAIGRVRVNAVVFQAGGQQVLFEHHIEGATAFVSYLGPRGTMRGILYQADRRLRIVAEEVNPVAADDAAVFLPEGIGVDGRSPLPFNWQAQLVVLKQSFNLTRPAPPVVPRMDFG